MRCRATTGGSLSQRSHEHRDLTADSMEPFLERPASRVEAIIKVLAPPVECFLKRLAPVSEHIHDGGVCIFVSAVTDEDSRKPLLTCLQSDLLRDAERRRKAMCCLLLERRPPVPTIGTMRSVQR